MRIGRMLGIGALVLGAQLGMVAAAGAAVTLTASRQEALFSSSAEPDCTELHMTEDGTLPMHVVRLRATVVEGAPADARYRWSLPRPAVGMLLADDVVEEGEGPSEINGFCAEFGSACVLTKEKLPFYNKDTILWAAPTCEELPKRTTRDFRGDLVRFRVKVTSGRRRLGRATAIVGYGRIAAVQLSVFGRNGIGKPDGVNGGVNPLFEAREDARGTALPPLAEYLFMNGDGGTASATSCPDPAYDACDQSLLYRTPGRFLAVVEERFTDGSALCDNLVVRVGTCEGNPVLKVRARPKRNTYQDGQEVGLRVRFRNASPQENGCGFLLSGERTLTCAAEVRIGGTTETATTTFEIPHCSQTVDQFCTSDADCECAICNEGEFCLNQSHCSQTFSRACSANVDCLPPACPECKAEETCVRVFSDIQPFLGVGKSIDLIDQTVTLRNALPDTAVIRETWTVTTVNAGSDTDKIRYRIRGRR